MICNLCPRKCNVERDNKSGFCNVGKESYVARAALHMWEEPFISGKNGSGTIFFCGCNLRCIFCQNYEISTCGKTEGAIPVNAERTADIMLKLQNINAHNINFVTPTPHIPLVADAIQFARARGLCIPVAYNTNSYVEVSSLKMLEGLVDIYMPDLKYVTPALSKLVSAAENYPETAKAAIAEMYRQVGNIECDANGIARRGMVIRHLVLPGNVDETRRVLDYIAENYPRDIHMSLMAQYFPAHRANSLQPFDRRLLPREYKRAREYAYSLGFTNLLLQELSSAESEYVPAWGEII